MKILFACVLASLVCATTILAQPRIHLGVTTTVNSTFVLDKGLSTDPRYNGVMTYKWSPVGFTAGIDFSRKFGLQIESIRAVQGQIYQVIDIYEQVVGERNIDLRSLQLPLLLRFIGGSDKAARMNFQLGPQLSILQSGTETMYYDAATLQIPEGEDIPEGAVPNGDGTYHVPELEPLTLLSSTAEEQIRRFKDKEVQLAFGLGVDIDMLKHFYLSVNVRGNYSFTDLRNEELISMIRDQRLDGILEQRANLLVGMQLGLHWIIGGNRSYRKKKAEDPENQGR
jgi:hypothetical protein